MIPNTLLSSEIWVCRRGKIPHNPKTGKLANCSDSSTWTDYRTAERTMWKYGYDGLSFAIADGLVGLDLDACFDWQLTPFAAGIVSSLQSYTEFSIGGAGVHIVAAGKIPASRRTKGLEIYGSSKFLAFTGRKLDGVPFDICDRQAEIDALYCELFPEAEHRRESRVLQSLSDEEVLARASRNPQFVSMYYEGDLSAAAGDWSSADLSLMHMLRRAGASTEQADRLFRAGALFRQKWLRTDYRERTLARAFC